MSRPNAGSPNWYWEKLGYSIERIPSKREGDDMRPKQRVIRRQDGSVVDTGDGSHKEELAAAEGEFSA